MCELVYLQRDAIDACCKTQPIFGVLDRGLLSWGRFVVRGLGAGDVFCDYSSVYARCCNLPIAEAEVKAHRRRVELKVKVSGSSRLEVKAQIQTAGRA
jgi:hypothetical protein